MANDLPRSQDLLASLVVMNTERQRLCEKLFDQFHDMSFDGVGISRETYGPSETAAMQVIEKLGIEHGFKTEWDAARNLVLRLPGLTTLRGGAV